METSGHCSCHCCRFVFHRADYIIHSYGVVVVLRGLAGVGGTVDAICLEVQLRMHVNIYIFLLLQAVLVQQSSTFEVSTSKIVRDDTVLPSPIYSLDDKFIVNNKTTNRIDYSFVSRGNEDDIVLLLARVLKLDPNVILSKFYFKIIPKIDNSLYCINDTHLSYEKYNSELFFVLCENRYINNLIYVYGTSGVDLATGVAFYLRRFLNMSFSWEKTGGHQINYPADFDDWPSIGNRAIVRYRRTDVSYFSNVVAFSYTYAFYKFEQWEYLIDWMALNGINVVIAYTGQEEVFRKVLNTFGVENKAFSEWSNGPAHMAWSRGQSMHNIAGPLSMDFMANQWDLQRLILKRLREIGIVPILPAFQAWLDATDPLFHQIGVAYCQQIIKDFGVDINNDGIGDLTEHWWEADGYFSAGDPPWYKSKSRPKKQKITKPKNVVDKNTLIHATKVYKILSSVDPLAIWFYQGWILNSQQVSIMSAFKKAVPDGRFVIADMWAEYRPIWNQLDLLNIPFIYGTLQNFGGNTFMGGNIKQLFNGTATAKSVFESFKSKNCIGIGAFPEGIDQSPTFYTYLYDTIWLNSTERKRNLTFYATDYALQRYGSYSVHAERAWHILIMDTVYGTERDSSVQGMYREKNRDALTASPFLGQEDTPPADWYDVSKVMDAWHLLVLASEEIETHQLNSRRIRVDSNHSYSSVNNGPLHYDIVNTGREVLAKLSNRVFYQLNSSIVVDKIITYGGVLMDFHIDADRLLCSDYGFRLDTWLNMANTFMNSDRLFHDFVARAQVSTWIPACNRNQEQKSNSNVICGATTGLMDYSNKQWGGLVGTFYYQRLQCYIRQAIHDYSSEMKAINTTAYYDCIEDMSYAFQHDYHQLKFPLCKHRVQHLAEYSKWLISKYSKFIKQIKT